MDEGGHRKLEGLGNFLNLKLPQGPRIRRHLSKIVVLVE